MKLKWRYPFYWLLLHRLRQGRTELQKDPVMRRLAEEIIVGQQSEIDAMNL